MIKFKMTHGDGRQLIGFGITQDNVDRLKDGKPILVDLREMGIAAEITIFYGETIDDVYAQVKPMIGDETVITHDAPDESGVSENEQSLLRAAGYKVRQTKHGWSPSFRGNGLIRGWAKTEGKAWWICWSHSQRSRGEQT